MAKYEIRQDDRNRRRVRISRKRLELHWPAMAVCLLLAVLLWLYVVNGGLRRGYREPPVTESGAAENTVPAPDAASVQTACVQTASVQTASVQTACAL